MLPVSVRMKLFLPAANKRARFCHYQCEDQRLNPRVCADFPAFYHTYGDRIYRFCYRLSANAAEAEDLAQEVFLAAYLGAGRFEGRASVQTWLYKIALNCWHQSRRTPRLEMTALPANAAHGGPGVAEAVTEAVALTCALSALPDDLRETFLLVKAEGLTSREAARVLNIPPGTVQWRVHAAARRLRVLLTEE